MSDLTPVIVNGIGSPRAWLFTNDGEPIRDFDEQIISKFLSKFSYTYNEEEDDECEIKFLFPTLRSFDLPYFQQDVVLHVEWGYITTGGEVIKSPRRKIAIRDLKTDYKKDGIELTIKCTDLVSYLKGMKTQRVNNYRTIPGTGKYANGADAMVNKARLEQENIFYDNIINGSNNTITVTQTDSKSKLVVNKAGEVKYGIKNPTTGNYKPQSKKPTSSMGYGQKVPQVLRLNYKPINNLGNTTFDKALESRLKWQTKLDQLGQAGDPTNLSDSDGPKIKDGTDDNLEIKSRDFSQPIFKQFTYYGGSGELLNFKSSTETRKNKESKTISSGVDPYSKKIYSHQVDTTDSKELIDENGYIEVGENKLKLKYQGGGDKTDINEAFKQTFQMQKDVYQKQQDRLDPNIKIKKTLKLTGKTKVNAQIYMGYVADRTINKTYKTSDIIAMPGYKDYANAHRNPELKNFDSSSGGSAARRVLTGYTIEKIQRKYTASAETIGDPTLIKGKVYQFNNLGRLDKGKWYATSVQHELDMDTGYTCKIELMKNPSAISISAKTYSSNPKFDRKTDEITIEPEIDTKEGIIYNQVDEDNNNTLNDMDLIQQEGKFREEGVVEGMNNRLDFLKAEDDSFEELVNNEEFKIGNVRKSKSEPNAQEL